MDAGYLKTRRYQEALNLLQNQELCDFEIHVDGSTFKVHKFQLATWSPYFKAMFRPGTKESGENKVHLQNVRADTFKSILNFCYTDDIDINIENVQEILTTANFMQIAEIVDICVQYITTNISASNCLGVLTVAYECSLRELYNSTFDYCLDKFETIRNEPEFLDLEENLLERLIKDNQLNVDREENVLNAVIDWVSTSGRERVKSFDNLVRHIRFAFIEPRKLVNLAKNKYVSNSTVCHKLIEEAKSYLLLWDHPEDQAEIKASAKDNKFQSRVPQHKLQRIYVIGGWTNECRPMPNVEKYDPYLDEWVEVQSMTRPRCGVGAAVLNNHLYAIGGHDGKGYLKSIERYDFASDNWIADLPDMNWERTSVGVVVLKGFIYAIGGQLGHNTSEKVEKYDPKSNKWTDCAPLSEKRFGAGVAVLNELIYVMGGADQTSSNTVECYNPRTNKWKSVAPMTTHRKHLSCATYQNKIYAVGGRCDSDFELDTAECYDPTTNSWETLPKMSARRSGLGLVVLDDLIYAIGGHCGRMHSKLVEAYDPVNKHWIAKKPMLQERIGAGFVVYSPKHDGNLT